MKALCMERGISTFLIPHIHGPLLVSAEVVDGFDHAARVSSSGVLLYCTQEPLRGDKLKHHSFTIVLHSLILY